MKLTLIIVCLFVGVLGWSQPNAVSGAFTEHTVESGQTLYSISKRYNLTIEQIVADNPGADQGLRVGQKLRIAAVAPIPISKGTYVVKSGDTYYGISRAYGISVEELKALNNGMPAGLIPGDSIVVPASKPEGSGEQLTPMPQENNVFDIVVMLPFYTTSKDTLVGRDIRLREAAVSMYRGVMAAADSLQKAGLKARIRFIDVLDNKIAIHAVLKKKEMNGVDLVIGPLFKDVVPEVAAWCAANGAHMVVPVQQPNRVLLNAPALSKAVAGSVTQWMTITKYAHKNFSKENVVLVDSKILDDRKMVEAFKEEWFKLNKDSLKKVVVCDDLNNLKIAAMLPSGKCLVALPTNDKKVIAAVFKSLGNRTDVEVIGVESWDDMDVITTEMRNKFHVSFPKQSFPNEADITLRRWQENYRKKFKSEPTDFAYNGYDVTLFFGTALMNYGASFTEHFKDVQAATLASDFDFFRTSAGSGFENAAINIVRTDNYQLLRAN
jgi:LysM repeat protein/ABC-type branched-subunit amino acid transport system substrate-binding protein